MQPVPRSFQAHRPVLDEAWPAHPPGSPRYDPKQNFRLPLELGILTNRRCAQRYQRGLLFTGSRTNLAYRSRVRFFLCTLLAALLLPLSARSEVQGEIHFQYRDGLIWLKVNIAGKSKPLNFLLDSGAGISAIDLRTARTLGVLLGSRQIVLGVNGQGFAFQVSDLHAVCAGVDLPKTVLAVDLRALSDCCERPVDGILGADFFRSRIVQIDFRDGRVRILE